MSKSDKPQRPYSGDELNEQMSALFGTPADYGRLMDDVAKYNARKQRCEYGPEDNLALNRSQQFVTADELRAHCKGCMDQKTRRKAEYRLEILEKKLKVAGIGDAGSELITNLRKKWEVEFERNKPKLNGRGRAKLEEMHQKYTEAPFSHKALSIEMLFVNYLERFDFSDKDIQRELKRWHSDREKRQDVNKLIALIDGPARRDEAINKMRKNGGKDLGRPGLD